MFCILYTLLVRIISLYDVAGRRAMSCGRGTDRHSHWYVHGYRHHICASTSTEDEHRSTRTVQPAKYRGECLLLTPDKPARRVGLVYLDRVLDGVCRSRCRGIVSSAPAAHMRGSCAAGFPAVGWGTPAVPQP